MRRFKTIFLLLCLPVVLTAKEYYVATNGNDANAGSIDSPFATLSHAQSVVAPGDVVYIRGGKYTIEESQIMGERESIYACVFLMDKSGTGDGQRICYFGYPGERPVFDLSQVKPAGKRVSVFYVSGSYLHFKNIEVVGTQVTVVGHTQSECFSNRGGNNNIYENLSMHDGMGIGFYLVKGAGNLVLNCDAYNNYDTVSDGGKGGNVDGFGGHPDNNGSGNVFRGCRAWWNSDDGFDLINSGQAVVIDRCWSFYNGYQPGSTSKGAGDGTGFKAGGYGMSNSPKVPDVIPMHEVTNCIAYYNKNKGFYANHHLGGILWSNNSGYMNPSNYCMLNRKSAAEAENVPGYGHILKNNLSYAPRTAGMHIIDIDNSLCTTANNSFLPTAMEMAETDFVSLDATQLTAERKADGSLPDITFLQPKEGGKLYAAKIGYSFEAPETDEDNDGIDDNILVGEGEWLMEATIRINGSIATVEGPGAENFTNFYINGKAVKMSNGEVDLSAYNGPLELKATTQGGIAKLNIYR